MKKQELISEKSHLRLRITGAQPARLYRLIKVNKSGILLLRFNQFLAVVIKI